MRRLPIFFVLDVSESMAGENLYQLEAALNGVVANLRRDPHALESVYIAVIVFAGSARTLTPLTDLAEFNAAELPIGGGTGLGTALEHLMREIDREVVRNAPDRKGDWRSVVFLMTDGRPTDDPSAAIARWNREFRDRAHMVPVSVGGGADHTLLQRLSQDVLVLNETGPEGFKRFVEFVSQTVQAQSRSVSAGQDAAIQLAKTDESVQRLDLTKHAAAPSKVDERYAVLIGKCSKNALPYLIKYERAPVAQSSGGLAERMGLTHYALRNTYPLKASYFDLCDPGAPAAEIHSQELIGAPNCPHCGARCGLAVCTCSKVHCIAGMGENRCPWCGNVGQYGEGGEDGFDIARGRG